MPPISQTLRAGASAAAGAAAAVLLLACGPPRGIGPEGPVVPAPTPLPPRPLAQVFVLAASGAVPADTTLTVAAGAARVVVLRRSAPDFGLFARLEFPDSSLKSASGAGGSGGAIRLTIRPRPGEYALDLEVGGRVGPGATILFSYGAHFVAPAGAVARYRSDIYFERELVIGRLAEGDKVVFLPTSRPGSDILMAPITGPGRYLVAAPR